jgi:hypothetical protein
MSLTGPPRDRRLTAIPIRMYGPTAGTRSPPATQKVPLLPPFSQSRPPQTEKPRHRMEVAGLPVGKP